MVQIYTAVLKTNQKTIYLFRMIPKVTPTIIPVSTNVIHSVARLSHTQQRQNACLADGMSSSSTFCSAYQGEMIMHVCTSGIFIYIYI